MNAKTLIFHVLGLSSTLGMAIFNLNIFLHIWINGKIIGVEPNRLILALEIVMSVFGSVYTSYLIWRLITLANIIPKQMEKEKEVE